MTQERESALLCCLFWLWCDGVVLARFVITNGLKSIRKTQRARSEGSETSAEHEEDIFHFGSQQKMLALNTVA